MRREWIEIKPPVLKAFTISSPSMRREWIEMLKWSSCVRKISESPSMRREWIEI